MEAKMRKWQRATFENLDELNVCRFGGWIRLYQIDSPREKFDNFFMLKEDFVMELRNPTVVTLVLLLGLAKGKSASLAEYSDRIRRLPFSGVDREHPNIKR